MPAPVSTPFKCPPSPPGIHPETVSQISHLNFALRKTISEALPSVKLGSAWTQFAVSGTGTDVVSFVCVGN